MERASSQLSQGASLDSVPFGNGMQTSPDTSNVGLQLEQLEQQVRDARAAFPPSPEDTEPTPPSSARSFKTSNSLPYQLPDEAAQPVPKDLEMEANKVQRQQLNLLELSRSRRSGDSPEIKRPAVGANGVR